MNAAKRVAVAGVIFAFLAGSGAALAGLVGALDSLISSKSPYSAFLGTWVRAGTGQGDIDRVIVTATDSGQLRMQVFGRCENRSCNWGALVGRPRYDSAESETVRGIAADYNLGFAQRHLVLHLTAGNTLRFDLATEFTDGSPRHDYEATGQLAREGTASTSAPAAAPPPSEAENSVAAGAASGPASDDCMAFDTGHLYVASQNGNWVVRDFLHPVQSFGPYHAAANRALNVIAHYRFEDICRIGYGKDALVFYRVASQVPRTPMPDASCSTVSSAGVKAVQRNGHWIVADGTNALFDYDGDRNSAEKAVAAIKSYGLNRRCSFDKDVSSANYWLAQ